VRNGGQGDTDLAADSRRVHRIAAGDNQAADDHCRTGETARLWDRREREYQHRACLYAGRTASKREKHTG